MLTTSSVIDEIFSRVDHHIQEEDLIKELNMSALPSLYENFVQLIEYLVSIEDIQNFCILVAEGLKVKFQLNVLWVFLQRENKREDKDKVVIVLLNMLEIVTRDIIEDPIPRYKIQSS